jgi:Ca2+-binding RTX toxin-like protein
MRRPAVRSRPTARRSVASVTAVVLAAGLAGSLATAEAGTSCTIEGTAGGELLVGTDGADVICARGGPDWIDPGRGNDLVLAGSGDDFVHGSAGADTIRGGGGRDHLVGGNGPDVVVGQDGSDRCLNLRDGVAGNDRANGGTGLDAGARNADDHFAAIEIESKAPPYCPPAPPRPAA